MTTKKLFPCKIEDLPVIAETVVGSARRDIADFSAFSPEFTELYFDAIDDKIVVCGKKLRSWVVIQELKATTEQLVSKTYRLRPKLNLLEGYLKLASEGLDVKESDLGLTIVRNAISKGNVERVILSVTNLLVGVQRNQAALEAKGLNPLLIDEIAVLAKDINTLDVKQNELESIRNRLTEENMDLFNDLWKALLPVLDTGKALYRVVDPAKLKDYTAAQLLKRLNHSGKRKQTAD
jgi:hypothetical protein